MVDSEGNEVVPFTHQIIKSANEGNYIPTQQEREMLQNNTVEAKGTNLQETTENPVQGLVEPHRAIPQSPMSIQQEIEQAEKRLAELKEKKAQKILEMKKQLELLESQ